MTDRVLSDDELQHMISSRGRVSLDMANLIISHRLQAARIQELEEIIRYNDSELPTAEDVKGILRKRGPRKAK